VENGRLSSFILRKLTGEILRRGSPKFSEYSHWERKARKALSDISFEKATVLRRIGVASALLLRPGGYR
jgi:hypothetical protein